MRGSLKNWAWRAFSSAAISGNSSARFRRCPMSCQALEHRDHRDCRIRSRLDGIRCRQIWKVLAARGARTHVGMVCFSTHGLLGGGFDLFAFLSFEPCSHGGNPAATRSAQGQDLKNPMAGCEGPIMGCSVGHRFYCFLHRENSDHVRNCLFRYPAKAT